MQSWLLVRPGPREGEALTSWASRVAWENGYMNTFKLFAAMRAPLSSFTDLDVDLDVHFGEFLSRSTGKATQAIESMTVTAAFGDASASLNDAWRRHLCLHRVYRSRRTMTPRCSICVVCLQNGDHGWHRAWRLPWVTRCAVHGCMLKDRCDQCGEVIEADLLRLHPLPYCGRCGVDMTEEKPGCDEARDKDACGQSLLGVEWLAQLMRSVPPQVIQTLLGGVMDRWFFHMQARLPGITEQARLGMEALSKNPPTRIAVGRMGVQERHILFSLLGRMLYQYPHHVRETFEMARCAIPVLLTHAMSIVLNPRR